MLRRAVKRIESQEFIERQKLTTSFGSTQDKLILSNINGLLGQTHELTVAGMITSTEEGVYHLEDETMKIRLDLCLTESDGESYFVPGNIVLCTGKLVGTKMQVKRIYHPQLYKSKEFDLSIHDYFGAYDKMRRIMSEKS